MNPLDMTRVGLYAGDFAPIKKRQVDAAKAFMEQMKLDYLFVMPKFISKEKMRGELDASALRLKLCELAFSGTDGVIISDAALGEDITVCDILKELTRDNTRLFLLVETDSVLGFDSYPCFEEILKLCYPSYVRWDEDPLITNRIIAKITGFYQKYGVMFRRIVADTDNSLDLPKAAEDYLKELELI